MQVIDSHFIGNFKDGDNICYNLNVLRVLYQAKSKSDLVDEVYLYKPQVIFIVSIIEAALDDLFFKIRNYVHEGVPNISDEIIVKVRQNKKAYRKFENHIRLAEKYDFFDVDDAQFYEKLDYLRKIRNRIHIQNNKRYTPLNESRVFTAVTLANAEKVCEHVLNKMSSKYHRRITARNYVEDFELPWDPHSPDIT